MNADGTGVRPLTDHPGDDRLPGFGCRGLTDTWLRVSPWSPDGRRIAIERFTSPADSGTIHIADVDGPGLRRLTDFPASFNGWSPSGARVALTRRTSPAAPDIVVIGADGSDPRNITNSAWADRDALWIRD